MPKRTQDPPKPAKRPLRTCRYCRARFKPIREQQHFCCATHRKKYWQYGALPFDKLLARLDRTLNHRIELYVDGEVKPQLEQLREMVRAAFKATELAVAVQRTQIEDLKQQIRDFNPIPKGRPGYFPPPIPDKV